MSKAGIAVFGIFTSRMRAEQAIDRMITNGFSIDDISVLTSRPATMQQVTAEKHTKIPEAATAGATAGAAIGGTIGLLAGTGVLPVPGAGRFVAAGPIMGALAGMGSGVLAGGIVGSVIGSGIPEYEIKRYQDRVESGGILVSVHCAKSEWVLKTKNLLEHYGAEDISSVNEPIVSTAGVEKKHRTRGANRTHV
jgi:hypothetical protein